MGTCATQSRGRRCGRALVVLAAAALLPGAVGSAAEDCDVAAEQGGMRFPVDRLDPGTRCLISPVVSGFTTNGVVGPVQTPIGREFFEYLLDRPVVLAALVERLRLGHYRFTEKGAQQYWVDDGDGTQGLLRLLYRDDTGRIYHIDGYHEGRLLPRVNASAVVFLRLTAGAGVEGHPSVESKLIAYTKLKDTFFAALVRMLRPLVGGTVTRKLSRGFDATIQLGRLIAEDPGRVVREVDALERSGIDGAEAKALRAFLRAMTEPAESVRPAGAAP